MSNPHVTVFEELGGPYVSLVIEIERYGRSPTAEISGFTAMEEIFFAQGWQLEHEAIFEFEAYPDLDTARAETWLQRVLRRQRHRSPSVARA